MEKIIKGKKQEKKPTAAQMERRLRNAILHIDKTRETQHIYFDDKGLGLTVNEDVAIIATGAHRHVFDAVTASGISRPYIYTKRLVEIALENDCTIRDEQGNVSHSYVKLFSLLKDKDDKTEYNLCWFIDLWLNNIFAQLYTIDESEISAFTVYEAYLHHIARQQVLFAEHAQDMTNIQFFNALIAHERKYMEGVEEHVIIHKKTDEENAKEEITALQETMIEQNLRKEVTSDGK